MNALSSGNDDHAHRQNVGGRSSHDDREMQNALADVINIPVDKGRFVTRTPEEPFRLTFVDVTCLLINRTIGTGIFNGPRDVMKGVGSPGLAILVWVCGCIYGLSGAHVFLEYGLNVPRYVIDGVEQSVPRSGGELHYLQYVFPWPSYKKGTVLLSGVLFGISFILVGNMASNCIDCAVHLMQIANPDKKDYELNQEVIRGIAIVIAAVTCFIHAFSRRGGILLNNVFAIIKTLILVFIIIATWVVAGRRDGISALLQDKVGNVKDTAPTANDETVGAPQAFLSVIFAFFGFDQPSYVLGEIKNPRKNLPRSMWWGMGIVSVLYVGVNICYMIIVPADAQVANNVAQEFFKRVFKSDSRGQQTVNAFLAISSFGNVVVWTYTAARMKQEIAKQGFIPFAKFFAKNKDFSLGKLVTWLEGGRQNSPGCIIRFLNPANHSEKTPVGALLLHFLSCLVLILATWKMAVSNAYNILFRIFTYIIAAWFGFFLALGILILHFRGPPPTEPVQTRNHNHVPDQPSIQKTWAQMIKGTVNPNVGIFCATLYLAGSLYPIIMNWVPPSGSSSVEWYVVPVISWCVLAFSAVWFLGFVAIAKYRSYMGHKEFVYVCELEFDQAEKKKPRAAGDEDLPVAEASSGANRGGLILLHETIYMSWQAMETHVLHGGNGSTHNADDFAIPNQHGANHEHRQRAVSGEFDNTDFAQ